MFRKHRVPTLLLALALSTLVAPSGPSGSGAIDGDTALARLQEWLDGTRDLQGEFDQSLVSGALGTGGVEEGGRLYIQRPGRMRWDYRKPERKMALIEGDQTWLYMEEDAHLIRGRLEGESDLLPRLLAGTERLGGLFLPTLERRRAGDDPDSHRLRLTPRASAEGFEHVTVVLRAPEFSIEAAEVLDAVGNRVLYRFRELERNRGIEERTFRFEPPPGTAVSGAR